MCGRSVAAIASSNPPEPLVSDCCVLSGAVEVSASSRSLYHGIPNLCGVSEFDREAWIMRRPWLARGCCAMWENKKTILSARSCRPQQHQ